MKSLRLVLPALIVAGGLAVPSAAHADPVKEGVFTLGVHMGNANGVLWGLLNSYDKSKAAHPGAVPLLHRQMRWSIDLAKVLKLPTGELEALDRDLDGLEFAGMNTRLQPILTKYRTMLGSLYTSQATQIFELGIQYTFTGASVRMAINDRPEKAPMWRAQAAAQGPIMAGNITGNKLEATLARAVDFPKRVAEGTSLDGLERFLADTLTQWTEDFRKAPPFGAAGKVVFNTSGSVAKSDPEDRERKGRFSKVHTVMLTAGVTYTIDVESGNGSAGPGFFDTWLRIEDASGKTLSNDDDGGEGLNSRATFRPTASGTYRLVVTTFYTGATGNYTLTVRQ